MTKIRILPKIRKDISEGSPPCLPRFKKEYRPE